MLKWRVAALTDAGCQRQRNEDSYYISPDQRVFAVADGMGGAVGGAMASHLAIEAIQALWQASPPPLSSKEQIRPWLDEAVTKANSSVCQAAEMDPSVRGMGTTIVVAILSADNHVQIAHVGDSRAYLLRESKPSLLTNDHSVVQEMVRAGRLTEEQARVNPYKNLITRCLGHEIHVEVEQTPVEVKPQDWIVLCSDGLPAVLRDEQICTIASQSPAPETACQEMIKQTLAGGAPDNVTVIAINFQDTSPQ